MNGTIEILSVGNELLLGNTINTNASWIAAKATSVGAEVNRITTVGDNLAEISTSVRESLRRRPDFLIITGGIGPTFDDMTLKGVAKALGLRVKLNPEAVKLVRSHYARRFEGRRMRLTKPRMKMASIPDGSIPIRNPVGTAPGVRIDARRTRIFCLPGVPSEAKAIVQETVLPNITARASGRSYVESWLSVGGIMESSLAPFIDRVMAHRPTVYIKSHPRGIENNKPRIELHFSTFAPAKAIGNRSVRAAVNDMKLELRRRVVTIASGKQYS